MQLRAVGLLACLTASGVTSEVCSAQSILNGSFTEGTVAPTSWEGVADVGKVSAVRDTKVFASAPASVRVDAVGGAATGKCMQAVRVEGNRSYRFKGKFKTNRISSGGLALVMFGPAGKQVGWNEVAMAAPTQDWCAFDAVTFVPPTTEVIVVMVYSEIQAGGSIWADDLSIEPVPDSGQISLANFRGSVLRSATDTWVNNLTAGNEGMTLRGTSRGQVASNLWFDLAKRATYTPVLELKALPGNTATELNLVLAQEGGGERIFQYKIPAAGGNFVGVLPDGNATLSRPSSGNANGAPGVINNIRLRGNGSDGQKLAVVVRRVELMPPGGQMAPAAGATTPPASSAGDAAGLTPLAVYQGTSPSSLYGSWSERVSAGSDGLRVTGASPTGGLVQAGTKDLRPYQDYVPVFIAKTSPGNKAKVLRVLLMDNRGAASIYDCDIQESADFTYFRPRAGVTLAQPSQRNANSSGQEGADLANITQVQIQGNYSSADNLSVVIRGAYLQAPAGKAPAAQMATAAKGDVEVVVVDETPGAAQSTARGAAPAVPVAGQIVQSTTGPAPVLRSFSVEGPDLLALEVEAQVAQVQGATRYSAEADDTQEEIEQMPGFCTVYRGGKEIGILDTAAGMLYQADRLDGISLTPDQVKSAQFQLLSSDDRNYGTAVPLQPSGIKARPADFAIPAKSPTMRYSVYLRLPKPLMADRSYEFSAPGLQIKPVKLRYNPAKQVAQSLHVSQVGFRPDDPAKIARMSLWMGSGGSLQAKPRTFQVLDDLSGKSVLDGRIESFYPADRPDSLTPGRSLSQADVFVMDLSALKTPGKYRLFVPEIGNSQPFEVRPSVWENAFTTVMRGFYAQRSGIDIGSPYAQFTRRRTYHILDNAQVRVANFSLLQTSLAPGGSGEDYHVLAAKGKPGATIADAMGGYLENGVSSVRRIDHLDASRQQLELMLLFPQYFSKLSLSIPEAGRKEVDLVDEALWNLDLYSKLQLADGGVCGGVVDPVAEMQYPVVPAYGKELLALAPDPYSSYIYAATAARAAVVLRANVATSQRLAQSAIRAFDWAERQPRESYASRAIVNAVRDRRNLAAAELLRLTGDTKYRDVFRQTTCLSSSNVPFRAGEDGFDQREAVFVYVRLPEASADSQLRQAALAAIKIDADQTVAIAQGNAWGLCGQGGSSTFYSTDAAQALLNAHYILKNEAYLKAAISHASFVLGGNPVNTSFVTGLGWQSVRNPVHPYTRLTRQSLPVGLVVNGVVDPRRPGLLQDPAIKEAIAPLFQPSLEQWPAAECLLDVYIARPACDYSVHETLGPTAYLLGYLAGR